MSRKNVRKEYRNVPRRGHVKPAIALVFLLVVLVFTISPWHTAKDYGTGITVSPADSVLTPEASPADTTALPDSGEDSFVPSDPLTDSAASAAAQDPAAPALAASAEGFALSLPNGTSVNSTDKRVDLSGLSSGDVPAAVQCLSGMQDVMVIDLGTSSLSGNELVSLCQAAPDARLVGTVQVNGTPVSTRTSSFDLTGLTHDAVAETAAALSCLNYVYYVNLGDGSTGLTLEDVGAIEAACPGAIVNYRFDLYGRSVSTADGYLDLSYSSIGDGGATVRNVLPYMNKCTYVDMDTSGVSSPDMAGIRDAFPDKKVVWRISFGNNGVYSVRTDVVKVLASKPSVGGTLSTDDVQCLRYLKDLMYLDLGHNDDIDNIDFIRDLPRLEVLIVAMDFFSDLSPVSNLSRLEYLEIQTTYVTDLSPLSGLSTLKHLNMCNLYDGVDLSPLMGMTQLERLWIGCKTPVDAGQLEQLRQCLPDTLIDTTAVDPHEHQWRQISWDIENTGVIVYHPRYIHLRDQFGYNVLAYSFNYLDPKYHA